MSEFVNTIDDLGDDAVIDSLIDRTIAEFKDDKLTKVGRLAFYYCSKLATVVLPKVTTVEDEAFQFCNSLKIVDFSSVVTFGQVVFRYIDTSLIAIILRNEEHVSVAKNANVFSTCNAILNKICYFYVPSALVDAYKSTAPWSKYADQIRALEDYTVDGTTTGELDETKI